MVITSYINQNYFYSYFAAFTIPEEKTLNSVIEKLGEPTQTIDKMGGIEIVYDGVTFYFDEAGYLMRAEILNRDIAFGPFYARVYVGASEKTVNRLLYFQHRKIKDLEDNQKGYIIGQDWVTGEWIIFHLRDKTVEKIVVTNGF